MTKKLEFFRNQLTCSSMMMQKYGLRIVAFLTLICFSATTLTETVSAQVFTPKIAPPSYSLPFDLEIPEAMGLLEDYYSPDPQPRLIVHLIQDAHTSSEAQENIFEMLKLFKRKNQLDAILVEGAVGPLQSQNFNFFAQSSENEKIWEKLMNQGLLSGVERFLISNSEITAHGLEDSDSYKKNLESYRFVLGQKKMMEKMMEDWDTQFFRNSNRLFSKSEMVFLKQWKMRHKHQEEMPREYSLELIKASEKYLQIDWSDYHLQAHWPNLIRFYKMHQLENQFQIEKVRQEFFQVKQIIGKENSKHLLPLETALVSADEAGNVGDRNWIQARRMTEQVMYALIRQKKSLIRFPHLSNYLAFLIFEGEIEVKGFMEEIEKMEQQLLNHLAQTPEQKKWVQLYRDYVLLLKGMELEWTRDEATLIRERAKDFQYEYFAQVNHSKNPEAKERFNPWVHAIFSFYREAEKREKAFIHNLFQTISTKQDSDKVIHVALIAGGYHRQGIQNLLREKNISHLTIRPVIKNLSESQSYQNALMGNYDISSSIAHPAVSLMPQPTAESLMGEKAYRNYWNAVRRILGDSSKQLRRSELRNQSSETEGKKSLKSLWKIIGVNLIGGFLTFGALFLFMGQEKDQSEKIKPDQVPKAAVQEPKPQVRFDEQGQSEDDEEGIAAPVPQNSYQFEGQTRPLSMGEYEGRAFRGDEIKATSSGILKWGFPAGQKVIKKGQIILTLQHVELEGEIEALKKEIESLKKTKRPPTVEEIVKLDLQIHEKKQQLLVKVYQKKYPRVLVASEDFEIVKQHFQDGARVETGQALLEFYPSERARFEIPIPSHLPGFVSAYDVYMEIKYPDGSWQNVQTLEKRTETDSQTRSLFLSLYAKLPQPVQILNTDLPYRIRFRIPEAKLKGKELSALVQSSDILWRTHTQLGNRDKTIIHSPESGVLIWDAVETQWFPDTAVMARSRIAAVQNHAFITEDILILLDHEEHEVKGKGLDEILIINEQKVISSLETLLQGILKKTQPKDYQTVEGLLVARKRALQEFQEKRKKLEIQIPIEGILFQTYQNGRGGVVAEGDAIGTILQTSVFLGKSGGKTQEVAFEQMVLVPREKIREIQDSLVIIRTPTGEEFPSQIVGSSIPQNNDQILLEPFQAVTIKIEDPFHRLQTSDQAEEGGMAVEVLFLNQTASQTLKPMLGQDNAQKPAILMLVPSFFQANKDLPVLVQSALLSSGSENFEEALIELMIRENNFIHRQQAFAYFLKHFRNEKFDSLLRKLIIEGKSDIQQSSLRLLRDENNFKKLLEIFDQAFADPKKTFVRDWAYRYSLDLIETQASSYREAIKNSHLAGQETQRKRTEWFFLTVLKKEGPYSAAALTLLRSDFWNKEELAQVHNSLSDEAEKDLKKLVREEILRRFMMDEIEGHKLPWSENLLSLGFFGLPILESEERVRLIEANKEGDKRVLVFSSDWMEASSSVNQEFYNKAAEGLESLLACYLETPHFEKDIGFDNDSRTLFPSDYLFNQSTDHLRQQQIANLKKDTQYADLARLLLDPSFEKQRDAIVTALSDTSTGRIYLARTYLQLLKLKEGSAAYKRLIDRIEKSRFSQDILSDVMQIALLWDRLRRNDFKQDRNAAAQDTSEVLVSLSQYPFDIPVVLNIYKNILIESKAPEGTRLDLILRALTPSDYELYSLPQNLRGIFAQDLIDSAVNREIERRAALTSIEMLKNLMGRYSKEEHIPGLEEQNINRTEDNLRADRFHLEAKKAFDDLSKKIPKKHQYLHDYLVRVMEKRQAGIQKNERPQALFVDFYFRPLAFLFLVSGFFSMIILAPLFYRQMRNLWTYLRWEFGDMTSREFHEEWADLEHDVSHPADVRKYRGTQAETYLEEWMKVLSRDEALTEMDYSRMLNFAKGLLYEDKLIYSADWIEGLNQQDFKSHIHILRMLTQMSTLTMKRILMENEEYQFTDHKKTKMFYYLKFFAEVGRYAAGYRFFLIPVNNLKVILSYQSPALRFRKYTFWNILRLIRNTLERASYWLIRKIYLISYARKKAHDLILKRLENLVLQDSRKMEDFLYSNSGEILEGTEKNIQNLFNSKERPENQIGMEAEWTFRKVLTRSIPLVIFSIPLVYYILAWMFGWFPFVDITSASLSALTGFILTWYLHVKPMISNWSDPFYENDLTTIHQIETKATRVFMAELKGKKWKYYLHHLTERVSGLAVFIFPFIGSLIFFYEGWLSFSMQSPALGMVPAVSLWAFSMILPFTWSWVRRWVYRAQTKNELPENLELFEKMNEIEFARSMVARKEEINPAIRPKPYVDIIVVVYNRGKSEGKEDYFRQRMKDLYRKDIPVLFVPTHLEGMGGAYLEAAAYVKREYPHLIQDNEKYPHLPKNQSGANIIYLIAGGYSTDFVSIAEGSDILPLPLEFEGKNVNSLELQLAHGYKFFKETMEKKEKRGGEYISPTNIFYNGEVKFVEDKDDKSTITLIGALKSLKDVEMENLGLIFGERLGDDKAFKLFEKANLRQIFELAGDYDFIKRQIRNDNLDLRQINAFTGMLAVRFQSPEEYYEFEKFREQLLKAIVTKPEDNQTNPQVPIHLVQDFLIPLVMKNRGEDVFSYMRKRTKNQGVNPRTDAYRKYEEIFTLYDETHASVANVHTFVSNTASFADLSRSRVWYQIATGRKVGFPKSIWAVGHTTFMLKEDVTAILINSTTAEGSLYPKESVFIGTHGRVSHLPEKIMMAQLPFKINGKTKWVTFFKGLFDDFSFSDPSKLRFFGIPAAHFIDRLQNSKGEKAFSGEKDIRNIPMFLVHDDPTINGRIPHPLDIVRQIKGVREGKNIVMSDDFLKSRRLSYRDIETIIQQGLLDYEELYSRLAEPASLDTAFEDQSQAPDINRSELREASYWVVREVTQGVLDSKTGKPQEYETWLYQPDQEIQRILHVLEGMSPRPARFWEELVGSAVLNQGDYWRQTGRVLILEAKLFSDSHLAFLLKRPDPTIVLFNSDEARRYYKIRDQINGKEGYSKVWMALTSQDSGPFIQRALQPAIMKSETQSEKSLKAFLSRHLRGDPTSHTHQMIFVSSNSRSALQISSSYVGRSFYVQFHDAAHLFASNYALLYLLNHPHLMDQMNDPKSKSLNPILNRIIGSVDLKSRSELRMKDQPWEEDYHFIFHPGHFDYGADLEVFMREENIRAMSAHFRSKGITPEMSEKIPILVKRQDSRTASGIKGYELIYNSQEGQKVIMSFEFSEEPDLIQNAKENPLDEVNDERVNLEDDEEFDEFLASIQPELEGVKEGDLFQAQDDDEDLEDVTESVVLEEGPEQAPSIFRRHWYYFIGPAAAVLFAIILYLKQGSPSSNQRNDVIQNHVPVAVKDETKLPEQEKKQEKNEPEQTPILEPVPRIAIQPVAGIPDNDLAHRPIQAPVVAEEVDEEPALDAVAEDPDAVHLKQAKVLIFPPDLILNMNLNPGAWIQDEQKRLSAIVNFLGVKPNEKETMTKHIAVYLEKIMAERRIDVNHAPSRGEFLKKYQEALKEVLTAVQNAGQDSLIPNESYLPLYIQQGGKGRFVGQHGDLMTEKFGVEKRKSVRERFTLPTILFLAESRISFFEENSLEYQLSKKRLEKINELLSYDPRQAEFSPALILLRNLMAGEIESKYRFIYMQKYPDLSWNQKIRSNRNSEMMTMINLYEASRGNLHNESGIDYLADRMGYGNFGNFIHHLNSLVDQVNAGNDVYNLDFTRFLSSGSTSFEAEWVMGRYMRGEFPYTFQRSHMGRIKSYWWNSELKKSENNIDEVAKQEAARLLLGLNEYAGLLQDFMVAPMNKSAELDDKGKTTDPKPEDRLKNEDGYNLWLKKLEGFAEKTPSMAKKLGDSKYVQSAQAFQNIVKDSQHKLLNNEGIKRAVEWFSDQIKSELPELSSSIIRTEMGLRLVEAMAAEGKDFTRDEDRIAYVNDFVAFYKAGGVRGVRQLLEPELGELIHEGGEIDWFNEILTGSYARWGEDPSKLRKLRMLFKKILPNVPRKNQVQIEFVLLLLDETHPLNKDLNLERNQEAVREDFLLRLHTLLLRIRSGQLSHIPQISELEEEIMKYFKPEVIKGKQTGKWISYDHETIDRLMKDRGNRLHALLIDLGVEMLLDITMNQTMLEIKKSKDEKRQLVGVTTEPGAKRSGVEMLNAEALLWPQFKTLHIQVHELIGQKGVLDATLLKQGSFLRRKVYETEARGIRPDVWQKVLEKASQPDFQESSLELYLHLMGIPANRINPKLFMEFLLLEAQKFITEGEPAYTEEIKALGNYLTADDGKLGKEKEALLLSKLTHETVVNIRIALGGRNERTRNHLGLESRLVRESWARIIHKKSTVQDERDHLSIVNELSKNQELLQKTIQRSQQLWPAIFNRRGELSEQLDAKAILESEEAFLLFVNYLFLGIEPSALGVNNPEIGIDQIREWTETSQQLVAYLNKNPDAREQLIKELQKQIEGSQTAFIPQEEFRKRLSYYLSRGDLLKAWQEGIRYFSEQIKKGQQPEIPEVKSPIQPKTPISAAPSQTPDLEKWQDFIERAYKAQREESSHKMTPGLLPSEIEALRPFFPKRTMSGYDQVIIIPRLSSVDHGGMEIEIEDFEGKSKGVTIDPGELVGDFKKQPEFLKDAQKRNEILKRTSQIPAGFQWNYKGIEIAKMTVDSVLFSTPGIPPLIVLEKGSSQRMKILRARLWNNGAKVFMALALEGEFYRGVVLIQSSAADQHKTFDLEYQFEPKPRIGTALKPLGAQGVSVGFDWDLEKLSAEWVEADGSLKALKIAKGNQANQILNTSKSQPIHYVIKSSEEGNQLEVEFNAVSDQELTTSYSSFEAKENSQDLVRRQITTGDLRIDQPKKQYRVRLTLQKTPARSELRSQDFKATSMVGQKHIKAKQLLSLLTEEHLRIFQSLNNGKPLEAVVIKGEKHKSAKKLLSYFKGISDSDRVILAVKRATARKIDYRLVIGTVGQMRKDIEVLWKGPIMPEDHYAHYDLIFDFVFFRHLYHGEPVLHRANHAISESLQGKGIFGGITKNLVQLLQQAYPGVMLTSVSLETGGAIEHILRKYFNAVNPPSKQHEWYRLMEHVEVGKYRYPPLDHAWVGRIPERSELRSAPGYYVLNYDSNVHTPEMVRYLIREMSPRTKLILVSQHSQDRIGFVTEFRSELREGVMQIPNFDRPTWKFEKYLSDKAKELKLNRQSIIKITGSELDEKTEQLIKIYEGAVDLVTSGGIVVVGNVALEGVTEFSFVDVLAAQQLAQELAEQSA